MEYSNRLEIRDRSKSDLDAAYRELVLSRIDFNRLMKDVPSGIPQPDGDLRIRKSDKASKAAVERHMVALRRFTDFIVLGTVPEDLLPPTERFGFSHDFTARAVR
uniref:Uncharacterized protein n=1 Tax=Solibacter usitatus (strain Ellin6076) TaxID=234267 RepID=Q01RH6_SOLUE